MANKIEFTKENYKSFFERKTFNNLSRGDRERLLRFTVEQVREEKGCKPITVRFEKGEKGSYGSCSQNFNPITKSLKGHTVVLNESFLTDKGPYTSYSVYDTIHHEVTHAEQYEKCANKNITNDNAEVLEQRLNDEHYRSASGDKINRGILGYYRSTRYGLEADSMLYYSQASEVEARAAGLNAVEELEKEFRTKHINDDGYLYSYIFEEKSAKLSNDRRAMESLGMHARESLAREELEFLEQSGKITEEQKENVLSYARQKDFESAKAVMLDYDDTLTNEDIEKIFNDNTEFKDFFESPEYKANKTTAKEHRRYKNGYNKLSEGEVLEEGANEEEMQNNDASEENVMESSQTEGVENEPQSQEEESSAQDIQPTQEEENTSYAEEENTAQEEYDDFNYYVTEENQNSMRR